MPTTASILALLAVRVAAVGLVTVATDATTGFCDLAWSAIVHGHVLHVLGWASATAEFTVATSKIRWKRARCLRERLQLRPRTSWCWQSTVTTSSFKHPEPLLHDKCARRHQALRWAIRSYSRARTTALPASRSEVDLDVSLRTQTLRTMSIAVSHVSVRTEGCYRRPPARSAHLGMQQNSCSPSPMWA